jgi:hypothetical protein
MESYIDIQHYRLFSSVSNLCDLINFDFWCFNATFSNISAYIMATSFSGGKSRSTRKEPPTMGKQLVNFITCDCESSAPFLKFTMPGANPRHIGDRLV